MLAELYSMMAANIAACNAATVASNLATTAANASTAATVANTAATAANTAAMATLLNRSSDARTSALKRNAKAADLDHPLVLVPHPDTGAWPPLAGFPADIRALRQMTSGQVNALLAFYGQLVADDPLVERRRLLAEVLGCDG